MKTNLAARKITVIYKNVKITQYPSTLSEFYNVISKKFKLNIDLKTLAIGISPNEDNLQTVCIFFYFKKKRNIVKTRKYFSFILDHPCEAYTSTNKTIEINKILTMVNTRCWGDVGLKTKVEAAFIEGELSKGRTPAMFLDIEDSSLRHMLYHSPTKIEKYSKYKQLYNHIKYLREKPRILFDIQKIKELGMSPELNYTAEALHKLVCILEFLNKHAFPSNRHYKSKTLHLWSNKPGMGKTSLINFLKRFSPSYRWPDDNWFDHYENDLYQWILWDEFRLTGQNTEFLKRLFAGDEMRLPVKGSHAYKKDNPLVVLTSNFSLQTHVWRKVRNKTLRVIELEALEARIHEIEVDERLIPCKFDTWVSFIESCLIILPK